LQSSHKLIFHGYIKIGAEAEPMFMVKESGI